MASGPALSSARVEISRQDGQPFAIEFFTATLLAITAGARGAIEIMPWLNGDDGLPDPVKYDAIGYASPSFIYNTPALTGFDAYKMTLAHSLLSRHNLLLLVYRKGRVVGQNCVPVRTRVWRRMTLVP